MGAAGARLSPEPRQARPAHWCQPGSGTGTQQLGRQPRRVPEDQHKTFSPHYFRSGAYRGALVPHWPRGQPPRAPEAPVPCAMRLNRTLSSRKSGPGRRRSRSCSSWRSPVPAPARFACRRWTAAGCAEFRRQPARPRFRPASAAARSVSRPGRCFLPDSARAGVTGVCGATRPRDRWRRSTRRLGRPGGSGPSGR